MMHMEFLKALLVPKLDCIILYGLKDLLLIFFHNLDSVWCEVAYNG